ncbi:MAG: hypothetical protein ACI3XI_02335 [Eubacteriales bacterium]
MFYNYFSNVGTMKSYSRRPKVMLSAWMRRSESRISRSALSFPLLG